MDPSSLSDAELSQMVRETSDDSAMRELISRHSGVYHNCVKSFVGNPMFSYEDAKNEKPFTIYSAAIGYDSSRGAFGTYLGTVARNRCLQTLNEKKRSASHLDGREIDFDSIYSSKVESPARLEEARDAVESVVKVVGGLSKDRQRIFSQRYLDHNGNGAVQKWNKIAEKEDCTEWNCIFKDRKTLKRIREKVGMELVGRTY